MDEVYELEEIMFKKKNKEREEVQPVDEQVKAQDAQKFSVLGFKRSGILDSNQSQAKICHRTGLC